MDEFYNCEKVKAENLAQPKEISIEETKEVVQVREPYIVHNWDTINIFTLKHQTVKW